MFIGHFAVALAAKRAVPETSLGTLTIGGQLIDLLFPVLVLLGLEGARIDPGNTRLVPIDFNDYPFSHSLLGTVAWAALAALLYYAWRRKSRAALVLAALVVSHWVLDLVTHAPDLPLYPGDSPKVGLGLWNSPVGTIAVEGALFLGGLWLYLRTTRAHDRIGKWGLVGYVALLLLVYIANLTAAPPPDPGVIGLMGLGLWLFPLLAWWVDRHRAVTSP